MAFYYVVPAVETEDGGLTADVPQGIAWVGQPHAGTYLVKTLVPLVDHEPLDELALVVECQVRGLVITEVLEVWAIGEKPDG